MDDRWYIDDITTTCQACPVQCLCCTQSCIIYSVCQILMCANLKMTVLPQLPPSLLAGVRELYNGPTSRYTHTHTHTHTHIQVCTHNIM